MQETKMIPLMRVHVPPKEKLMPALEETLYSGMLTEGDKVKEFEQKFQKKFNLPTRPLTTNSGTSALQLAYRCAKKNRKIVLTTPMTCFANICAAVNEGLKIAWCDIDPNTGNISPESVAKNVEKYGIENIAAISFVDLGGFPNDLNKLYDISKGQIPLIQDAAQSLGSKWNNYFTGADPIVSFVTFSFQAIKHLTTCDGGMLVIHEHGSNDDSLKRAKKLKWFGIPRESIKEEIKWHYDINEPGFKFHMNNVNATIGLSQLNVIDKIINKHKKNGNWYNKNLKNTEGIKLPTIPDKSEPSYWIYPLRVEKRENFVKMMKSYGIGTNIAHVRNDSYSCMKNGNYVLNHTDYLPGMNEYEKEYLFIPSGWWVTSENREYIMECIKNGW